MKNKSMKAITLTTALALALSATAWAGTPTPGSGGGAPPSSDEIKANSDTTISIFSTTSTQPNISYTVPLYVTMAVVNDQTDVKVPANYTITNTTPNDKDGSKVQIGVTDMSFEKISANGFKTVADAASVGTTDKDNIYLTIGEVPMPALTAKETKSFKPTGSILWNATDSKPKPLEGPAPINLPITGQVAKLTRTDTVTAAQFRLKYTVSLIKNGESLGAVYAGDDHTAAGLPNWDISGTN